MTRLCSICMLADADTIDAIEGFTGVVRPRPVCWPCLSPVPEPAYYEPSDLGEAFHAAAVGGGHNHASRDAVLTVVRQLGPCDTAAIRAALAIDTEAALGRLATTMRRLIQAGALAGEDKVPGVPNAGRIYRATGQAPAIALAPEVRALVSLLDEPATLIDLGTRHGQPVGPGAMSALFRAGLVEKAGTAMQLLPCGRRARSTLWRRRAA